MKVSIALTPDWRKDAPPTTKAGFATLELTKSGAKDERLVLAANPDCEFESDLSPISEKQLRTLYPDELAGERVHFLFGPEALAGAAGAESKTEFWMPLVIFAVALMLLETFCAWKFAHHIK